MNYLQSLHYALGAVQSKVRPNDAVESVASRFRNEIEGALAFAVIGKIKSEIYFQEERTLTTDRVDAIVEATYANLPRFNC